MARMTESELRASLWRRAKQAESGWDTALRDARETAMKYYRGDPFGNEVEGQSQVVTRDVAEAIDSLMPSLLEIFSSGDTTVMFEPTGPEDEEAAAQATDYVNHIWNQQNDGFTNFATWFKDALLNRLGVVKIWWDSSEQSVRESYAGLTPEQYDALLSDPEVEEIEHGETAVAGPDGQPAVTHDVVMLRTSAGPQGGRIRVIPIPPEEFICTPGLASLDDPPVVGHRTRKTISELLLMGYPREKVMALAEGQEDYTTERIRRHQPESDIDSGEDDESANDPSMRQVWLYELWARVDFDGDGIAELRKVCLASEGSVLLANEEDDGHPFAAVTPIIMPHKLYGQSIHDQTADIQLIKSTIFRQLLDNLYRVNMPQREVVEGQVNLDDLLSQRVGGIVRTKAPGMVREVAVPFTAGQSFPVIEYFDQIRDQRTGAARFSTGPGADSLNPYTRTATGANIADNRSKEKVALIARTFAETGVKRAFRRILELISKHQQAPKIIRLRNEWVPIDPRGWNTRMDMTVQVGLGTGSKDQQLASIMQLLALDQQIVQMQGGADGPLVTMPNIYKKLEKLVQAAGLKSVEPYYTDPSAPPDPNQPPKQPKPDPKMIEIQGKMELEKAKLGIDQQKTQAQIALDQQKAQADIQLQREKLMGDLMLKREGMTLDLQAQGERFGKEMDARKGRDAMEIKAGMGISPDNEKLDQIEQGLVQAMEVLAAIAQRQEQGMQAVLQAVAAPKQIAVQRDGAGRIVGATATPTIQ